MTGRCKPPDNKEILMYYQEDLGEGGVPATLQSDKTKKIWLFVREKTCVC